LSYIGKKAHWPVSQTVVLLGVSSHLQVDMSVRRPTYPPLKVPRSSEYSNVIRTGYSVPRSPSSVSIPLLGFSDSRPSPPSKKSGSSSLELWPFSETLSGAARRPPSANRIQTLGSSLEVPSPSAFQVWQCGYLLGSNRAPSLFGLSLAREVLTPPTPATLFHAAHAHGV